MLTLIVLLLALAPAQAGASEPAYYLSEHPPAGESRGIVVTFHGGGWHDDYGPAADEVMAPFIDDLTSWGYRVYNVGYRAEAQSLEDAADAVRRVAEANPGQPLCLLGASAGAQLAFTVAAERPDTVKCVVDFAGPPDLVDPTGTSLSWFIRMLAEFAFGPDLLAQLSPINLADRLQETAVLVVALECDEYISLESQLNFALSLARSMLVTISAGDLPMGHCSVDPDSYDAFRAAEQKFLKGVFEPEPVADLPPQDNPRLVVRLRRARLAATAGSRLRVPIELSAPAQVTVVAMRGERRLARATLASAAGKRVVRVRAPRREGRYRVRVTARGADHQRASDRATVWVHKILSGGSR